MISFLRSFDSGASKQKIKKNRRISYKVNLKIIWHLQFVSELY